jgi:hypothetical protein
VRMKQGPARRRQVILGDGHEDGDRILRQDPEQIVAAVQKADRVGWQSGRADLHESIVAILCLGDGPGCEDASGPGPLISIRPP